MPAIYHEGSWLGNATDPEVLVKDTVGWTGKNRAYSQTNNAVIAHIENGITYDVSWTGSATVTLKKNSASGATITSGSTSPLSFTADADYELYFGSSATVTNIMVKDSRITDPTYEPYHESVEEEIEQIYADNGVLGAKNLLPNNATSRTIAGVVFTVNDDGSITANGTASADSEFNWLVPLDTFSVNETYILSGCPIGGALNKYTLDIFGDPYNDTKFPIKRDLGNGVSFTIPSDTGATQFKVRVWFKSGQVFSNLKFYPMVRLASDPDDTYQPYAMTNGELTEKVFEKRTLTSANDLNNITETGIYGITTKPTNAPENTTAYCTLIVQKTAASDIRQIIIRSVNAAAYIYTRSYGGSPLAWTPWYKFTGTVVS